MINKYLLSAFLLFLVMAGRCGIYGSPQPDTVYLLAGAYFIINDSVFRTLNDTVITDRDSVIVLNQKNEKEFFRSLEKLSSRNKLTRRLFESLVKEDKLTSDYSKPVIQEESENRFYDYRGRVISEIVIKKLNVFGEDISDTIPYKYYVPPDKFDAVHTYTWNSVIRSNLLVEEGDTIHPGTLAEAEKRLRGLRFIYDALLQVYEKGADSAELYVITKDVFPWVVVPIFVRTGKWRVRIENVNIAGTGHKFSNTIKHEAGKKPELQWSRSVYSIQNIGRSFIESDIGFEKLENTVRYDISFSRSFIPFITRWTGGASVSRFHADVLLGTETEPFTNKYNIYDVWTGRYFPVYHQKYGRGESAWIAPALRVIRLDYKKRPPPDVEEASKYLNKTDVLAGFGIHRQKYYRINYFREFGRTEDLPYGYMFKATGGYSFGEIGERTYVGLEAAYGVDISGLGFMRIYGGIGSYLRNGASEQGVMRSELMFSPPVNKLGKYKLKNIFMISYVEGLNRLEAEKIFLGEETGIKDLRTGPIFGKKRVTGHLDANLFTPVDWYGFRLSVFTGLDAGLIGSARNIFHYPLYSSITLGIRVKNEFLVLGTYQFSFTWLPRVPEGSGNLYLDLFNLGDLKFFEFVPGPPGYVPYR